MKNYTVNRFCANCEFRIEIFDKMTQVSKSYCNAVGTLFPKEQDMGRFGGEDKAFIRAVKKWKESHREIDMFGTCDFHHLKGK